MNRRPVALAVAVLVALLVLAVASGWRRDATAPGHPAAASAPVPPRVHSLLPPIVDGPAGAKPAAPVPPATADSLLRVRANARDLFDVYRRLQASGAGGDLAVAKDILTDCWFATRQGNPLRAVAAGRAAYPGKTGVPDSIQVDAARDVLARCRGFDDMSKIELQQARADIQARLGRADDPVGWSDAVRNGRRPVRDDLLRAILDSQDPIAIADVGGELAARFRRAHGLPVTGDEDFAVQMFLERLIVGTLVSCDLVDHCGPDSFAMRQYCAFRIDRCTMDQRAFVLEDVEPADRPKVFAQVDVLVRAIRDRDHSVWGL